FEGWTGGRTRALSCGQPGLGHWAVTRGTDRGCDPSGARPWTAYRARHSSDCRERRLGLGICADTRDWSAHRWRAGRRASPRAGDFLIMSLMRSMLLAASQNQWLRHRATNYPFVRRTVSRFMPGETFEDALGAAEVLRSKKIGTVFTHLGENIKDRAEA